MAGRGLKAANIFHMEKNMPEPEFTRRQQEVFMRDRLEQIKEEVRKQVEAAGTLDKLNEVRVNALGKKGALTEVLKLSLIHI